MRVVDPPWRGATRGCDRCRLVHLLSAASSVATSVAALRRSLDHDRSAAADRAPAAAHAAAPADLQALLDQHESLPFRRRGYERDGMLKTVIKCAGESAQTRNVAPPLTSFPPIHPSAGFKELLRASQSAANSKAEVLAAVPAEVNRFVLDALFARPVQATLVEL